MIGSARLLTALSTMAKRARTDGVSACAHAKVRRVFRFADDAIHQGLRQESVTVTVKVIRDRRGFVAPANLYEHFRDHLTSVVRQRRERTALNDEHKRLHTGEYTYEWIYTRGDPHFLDAATYAVFAAERLAKRMAFVLT